MRNIWRIWALSLLALAVQSWATCQSVNTVVGTFGGYTYSSETAVNTPCQERECDYSCNECQDTYNINGFVYGSIIKTSVQCRGFDAGCGTPARWCSYRNGNCTAQIRCGTQCELDSALHYADCVAQPNSRWDKDSCKCVQNMEADSVFTVCTEDVRNGAPYYQIYVVNVHYKNGVLESACGVSPNLINGEGYKQYCALKRSGNGTCANAGVPNGPSDPKPCNGDCSKAGQEMVPTAECYAVVGYNCYLRDINTGNTFRCECDGSCSKAMTDLIRPLGEGANCRNPYNNPSSSDSGGSSSPSSSPSSSDSGGSSSPSSSAGAAGDYTQQLDQLIANTQGIMNNTGDISQWTQTTMNNTTDIKNSLSDIGIDVSHIRTNTENTANNTANIDSKLSTTNSLLNDIKNKDWNPTINVNPPEVNVNVAGDTNIINVSTDTSKAPAEIKGILETFKGAFDDFVSKFSEIFNGDDPTDATDTAGTGAREKDLIDSINAKVGGDTVPNMRDSIPKAITGVRGSLGALRDSLNGSAYGDSLNAWTDKLLDNGVLSGNGSNNCPQFLTRNFSWNMGPLGTWNLGSFRYICEPIAGVNITLWALARMVLRAMVAITCMLWLYRVVVGIDGGNNEEN